MTNIAHKSRNQKPFFFTTKERLAYYEDFIGIRSQRSNIIKDMRSFYLSDEALDFDQNLKLLEILTHGLTATKNSVDEKQTLADAIYHRVLNLNSKTYSTKKNDLLGGYAQYKNQPNYYIMVEKVINKIDLTSTNGEKLNKFTLLAEGLREVSRKMAFWKDFISYEGSSLKISNKIGQHSTSVLILPKEPKEAISLLYDDNARTLFAEYDTNESTETYIQKFFGDCGMYAEHYKSFLNCRSQYPSQKTILTLK